VFCLFFSNGMNGDMGKTTVSGGFPQTWGSTTPKRRFNTKQLMILWGFFGIFWGTWFYLWTTPDPRIFNCQLAQSSIGDLNSASEVQANRLPGLMRFVRWKVYGLKLTNTKMSGFQLLSIAWSWVPMLWVSWFQDVSRCFRDPQSPHPLQKWNTSGFFESIFTATHTKFHP